VTMASSLAPPLQQPVIQQVRSVMQLSEVHIEQMLT